MEEGRRCLGFRGRPQQVKRRAWFRRLACKDLIRSRLSEGSLRWIEWRKSGNYKEPYELELTRIERC